MTPQSHLAQREQRRAAGSGNRDHHQAGDSGPEGYPCCEQAFRGRDLTVRSPVSARDERCRLAGGTLGPADRHLWSYAAGQCWFLSMQHVRRAHLSGGRWQPRDRLLPQCIGRRARMQHRWRMSDATAYEAGARGKRLVWKQQRGCWTRLHGPRAPVAIALGSDVWTNELVGDTLTERRDPSGEARKFVQAVE